MSTTMASRQERGQEDRLALLGGSRVIAETETHDELFRWPIVTAESGSTMGGWYNPLAHYVPEELGGLPVERFIEAVAAEGGRPGRGVSLPLHLHPLLNEADIYGDDKPTRIAFAERDVRQPPGSLPAAEALGRRAFGIPSFKRDFPERIARYAAAYRKVAMQADRLC